MHGNDTKSPWLGHVTPDIEKSTGINFPLNFNGLFEVLKHTTPITSQFVFLLELELCLH